MTIIYCVCHGLFAFVEFFGIPSIDSSIGSLTSSDQDDLNSVSSVSISIPLSLVLYFQLFFQFYFTSCPSISGGS